METGLTSLNEQMDWSEAAAVSDILPTAYRNKPGNILVAIDYGESMGLRPAESLYRINVIEGKPTMSAELIASQVRKRGNKLHIYKDYEHMSVTAEIIRRDDPDFKFRETKNMEWAKRMGLAGKKNWVKDPMTMLKWRAITAVAREACPECLYGAGYTPDEMEESLDDVTATVVEQDAVQPQDTGEPLTAYANKEQMDAIREAFNSVRVHDGLPILWKRIVLAALVKDGRKQVLPKELTFKEADKLLKDGQQSLTNQIIQTVQSMWPEQTQPAPGPQNPKPQQGAEPQPETEPTKENQQ